MYIINLQRYDLAFLIPKFVQNSTSHIVLLVWPKSFILLFVLFSFLWFGKINLKSNPNNKICKKILSFFWDILKCEWNYQRRDVHRFLEEILASFEGVACTCEYIPCKLFISFISDFQSFFVVFIWNGGLSLPFYIVYPPVEFSQDTFFAHYWTHKDQFSSVQDSIDWMSWQLTNSFLSSNPQATLSLGCTGWSNLNDLNTWSSQHWTLNILAVQHLDESFRSE